MELASDCKCAKLSSLYTVEPMHVPLTSLFEPNQKFQEAILSIIITALTWFGLMDLTMRRRRRHTHGGLAQGVKWPFERLPSFGRCGNPQPDFLDSTKCFQPLSSAYTRHYKLWLGSPTLGWGCGTCRKCTKIVRRCTKLPFWGVFNNPPPTYLNPTKCFEPMTSDYTRP